MRAFRLTRAKYATFSGRGSLLASGRWHWAGVPMIYSAESRALAVLETLVHATKDQIPSDYVFYEIILDDASIERMPLEELPRDWTLAEPTEARTVGSEWMKSRRSAALLVPSVVIPQELNLLLNPEHSEFSQVQVIGPEAFQFDPRLFR